MICLHARLKSWRLKKKKKSVSYKRCKINVIGREHFLQCTIVKLSLLSNESQIKIVLLCILFSVFIITIFFFLCLGAKSDLMLSDLCTDLVQLI